MRRKIILAGIPVLVLFVVLLSGGCRVKKPPTRDKLIEQAFIDTAKQDSTLFKALQGQWRADSVSRDSVFGNWIVSFGDSQLNALVDEAIANNLNLRVSAARIEQAAGYVKVAKAALRPSIAIMGRGDPFSGISGAIFGVSWEPDIWGKFRYARNAAQASYASAQSEYEFAMQSIAAVTARSWFTAIEIELQIQISEEMVKSSEELVALTRKRFDVGLGGELDVTLAEASLSTYREGAMQLLLAKKQTIRALELLLGRYPSAELQVREAFPAFQDTVPAGLPLQILERRPDIIAAEQRVAVAFNRIGEAKAARLPTLKLTASFGAITSQALELKEDFKNPIYGISGSMDAPLYTGGALKGNIAIRTAEQKQAIAEYANIALNAIGEVEDALASSQTLSQRIEILTTIVTQRTRAVELQQQAYRIGKSDLRSVLQEQIKLLTSRMELVNIQSEQLIQRVDLYLALGGGY